MRVTSFEGQTAGSYTIHAVVPVAAGLSFDTATTVSLGVPIYTRIVHATHDHYFKFTVAEQTPVWIRSAMRIDLVGTLYDSERRRVAGNDDAYVGYNYAFSMAPVLSPGTYYLKVEPYENRSRGGYILQVDASQGPGNTPDTALPISLNELNLGRITSTSDRDYFRLDVDRAMYVEFFGRDSGSATAVSVRVLAAERSEVRTTRITTLFHGIPSPLFHHVVLLPSAGTYYIEASSSQSGDQRYVIQVQASASDQRILNTCQDFENSQTDFLYGCQWHLNNTGQFGSSPGHDINVEEVWESTKGEGVNIAIVDDGLQYSHPDLTDNVITSRNHSYYGDDVYRENETHGTAVAGLIAARDNEIGVRGAAPRASIYAYDLLAGRLSDAGIEDAMTRDRGVTAISSNSWGHHDLGRLFPNAATTDAALVRGVQEGFGGKGISYVFAAGNGALRTDNSNFDGYNNHYAVISACSVNIGGVRSGYSEPGANLWVCAPSDDSSREYAGITTTTTRDRYTTNFGGTSAAAPIVSGVIALVRATNAELTWRDVKLILAASARQVDADDDGWEEGALLYGDNPDMERYSFNHDYGFGLVDAGAAVALARDWPASSPPWREVTGRSSGEALSIPDAPASAPPRQ